MTIQLKSNHEPGRNDPCPCGSGLKSKHCHQDEFKRVVCNRVANEKMCKLILQEKIKKGLVKLPYHCNGCGKDFIEPNPSKVSPSLICPFCNSTDYIENKPEEINKEN
jgi:DNA-directed RNA polymerase subunit RPC12/RpoP